LDSDETLLHRWTCAAVDERRQIAGELFQRHYARVARWCYRLTGDRDAAADLTQEVFAKAYRYLDSYRGTAQFSTWLYAIARREAISYRQQSATRPSAGTDDELGLLPSPTGAPDSEAARESESRRVHRLLVETLDEVERAVFTLHYGDDMTLDQITRALDLTNTSGAKAYIVSARRKLARVVNRLRARGETS
jgi:RNA polymerase sigma-70 factor (ECF subfamily)